MKLLFLAQSPKRPDEASRYAALEAKLRSYTLTGTELDYGHPNDFPGGAVFEKLGANRALSGLHHHLEAPALVRKAVWAQENGYDAIVQSNTFDPGVEASRLAVSIPVIGVLRTSLHVAGTIGHRIGLLVPLSGHVPHVEQVVRSYGMGSFVCGIRILGDYGRVKYLRERRISIRDTAVTQIKSLVDSTGAEVVIPLGGAVIPEVVEPDELAEQVGVPVLNTKRIAVRYAEMCVSLRITHSSAAYPPARLSVEDYESRAFE